MNETLTTQALATKRAALAALGGRSTAAAHARREAKLRALTATTRKTNQAR